MNIFNTYKGLPRSIYALFFVQIINRFGDFVFPFLSLLLTQKLNFSYSITGVIVMITSLVSMPAALLGGKFADQISRRKTYFVGQGLAAVAILICGIIKNPIIIVVLLIISAFFNGFVRPTLSAIIADALTPEKRQIGGSLTYLGINIGVAVGPIVAGFLFNNYISLLFILDAFTSFIAIIIFYVHIDETKPKLNLKEDENSKEKEETGNLLQILLKRPQLTLFMIFNMFYCFAYTQISFSMPMMLNEVFGTEGTTKFGYLMSINALTVIFLTVIIITITRRLTTLVNIILAGIFYAVGFGMIGVIGNSFFLYIISTIIWSIGEVIASTNNGVYIANNSPKNFRARISAVSSLTYAISISLATSLVGRFIDSYGLNKVWTLVFFVVAVGVGFMTALYIYNLKIKKKAVKHREVAY